jgi:hypothetical protein
LAGQYFDIRLEVHAPQNGSEAIGIPPDENFTFTITKGKSKPKPATEYFKLKEPKLERWNFTWFEGMCAANFPGRQRSNCTQIYLLGMRRSLP